MPDPLNLVEEAIAALGNSDAPGARLSVAAAVALDQGLGAVADVIGMAATELERDGAVSAAAWNAIADACPGEVRAAIEAWRS